MRFLVRYDFLDKDPLTRRDDNGYNNRIRKSKSIVVVNKVEESGIKLIMGFVF